MNFREKKYMSLFSAAVATALLYFALSAADSVIAGHFVGTGALSAIAVVSPLSEITAFLGMLFIFGCRILYPRALGAKDVDGANRIFSCAFTLVLILTGIAIIALIALEDFYFSIYNLDNACRELAVEYYRYSKFVYAITPLITFIAQIVYADGDSRTSLLSNMAFVGVNILASIICAKSMGIAGIGLGSLLGGLSSLAVSAVHFVKGGTLKFRPALALSDIKELMKYGLLDASVFVSRGINGVVINAFITARFGDAYLAVFSTVGYAMSLASMYAGCSGAMIPILNIYEGENNFDGVKKILRFAMKVTIITGIALTAAGIALAGVIPRLFSFDDEMLIKECIAGIRISCLTMVFTGIVDVMISYYNCIGKNVAATIMARTKDTVIFLLMFLSGGVIFGFRGIWLGNTLTPVVTLIAGYFMARALYGKDNFLALPGGDKKIYTIDIPIDEKHVIGARDEMEEYLKKENADSERINRVMLLIEEYGMSILEGNPGKKNYMEITYMEDKEGASLIFRDSGRAENLTDEERVESLRGYVLDTYVGVMKNTDYMKVLGCSRKIYDL